jgi:hypothetical protein
MIDKIVEEMKTVIYKMQKSIKEDIADIKAANHDKLLERNDYKQDLMNEIVSLKQNLNNELVSAMQSGVDVNIYRQKVDSLEDDLRELYKLNGKLASIVLPVKQMYKEMVDELTERNGGGSLIDVKA